MQLQAIELIGFKSFPEKTKITFHKGMTAIVGPNGSGKSNITDAIRWVLGEQSAKSLRGKKMEDIIFSGTDSRRQMSYAEVNLFFDNSDLMLNIDFSEVKITRRLYRSGESEYKINGNGCRLKDLQSLFWDTGLGRDGYSIIGQGRVDELLSAKSEDRRKVFEEASGISKYRIKKEESLKKLLQTEENLERLEDILKEVETQIKPLTKQAEVAKLYLNLKEELKNLEITLSLKGIQEIENNYLAQNDLLETYNQDYQNIINKINLLEDAYLKEENLLNNLELDLHNLWEKKTDYVQKTEAHLGRKSLLIQKKKHLEDQIKNLGQQLFDKKDEFEIISQESNEKEEEIIELTKKISTLDTEINKYSKEIDDASNFYTNDLNSYNQLKNDYREKETLYFEYKEKASSSTSTYKLLKEELFSLQEDSSLNEEFEFLSLQEKELKDKLETTSKRKIEVYAKYENIKVKLDELRQKIESVDSEKNTINSKLQQLYFEEKKEKDWLDNYEGYMFPVKKIMTLAKENLKDTFSMQRSGFSLNIKEKIIGTVADLITCKPYLSTAIDVSLGNISQNIVVENSDTAAFLIEFLKKEKLGRATFLPLSSLKKNTLDSAILKKIENVAGFIGLASNLIEINNTFKINDENKKNILKEYLLGRIIIAKDLSSAREITKILDAKVRVVTLTGEIMQVGGAMTGGFLKNEKGLIFFRQQKLEELNKKINELKKEAELININLHNLESSFKEKGEELELKFKSKQELDQLYLRLDLEYQHILEKKLVKEESFLKFYSKKNTLEEKIAKLQEESFLYLNKTTHTQKELDNIKNSLSDFEKRKEDIQTKLESLREQINLLKIQKQTFKERLLASESWLKRLKYESIQKEDEHKKRELELKTTKVELDAILTEEENWSKINDELIKIQNKCQIEYDETWQKIQSIKRNLEKLNQDKQENTVNKQEIFQVKVRVEEKITRMKEEKNKLKLDLWEKYELTYDNCLLILDKYQQKKSLKENIASAAWLSLFEEIDEKTAKKKVSKLKEEINNLGSVNTGAISALSLLEERASFLRKQYDDIVEAKNELQSVIYKLNKDMKEIFNHSFANIKSAFHDTFKALFGGGQATLELEEPDKVLESAIEIKVSPPGKRLQNMLLLSGGERALAAIALLFALLKQKPAPFVILDEIEAALDEANVHRFASYVRSCIDQSQFILVTHRKGTMEICDRIYGVTMQEKGVSKLLSLDLKD